MAFLDNTNSVKCHWYNYGDGSNIQNAYNVSSVGDLGTGYFRINFSSGMANSNYTLIVHGGHSSYYDVMASGFRDISTNSARAEYSVSNNANRISASGSFGIVLNNS